MLYNNIVKELKYIKAKTLSVVLLLAVITSPLFVVFALFASSANADEIVAVVNKNVILKSELDVASKLFPRSSLNGASQDLSQEQVLDELITQRIQLDLADRLGIYVTDAEVDARADQLLRIQKLTKQQQFNQLNRDGLTYTDWLGQIRDAIRLRNLQFQQLRSYVKVNDTEIDNFIITNTPSQLKSASYDLVHLLVSEDNLAATQLQELYLQLETKNSIDAVENVLLELTADDININVFRSRPLTSLPEIFYKRLVIMNKGQAIYFKNDGYWHLIKVVNVKYPQADILSEYKISAISLQTNVVSNDARVKNRINNIYQEIQSGVKFQDLASIYFEQSSPLQGFLENWIIPEQLPPSVGKVVAQLNPGSFSKPFAYGDGWHIVYLEAERTSDRTMQKWRNNVYQELANRKLVITIPFWISDITSRAYVEKRL